MTEAGKDAGRGAGGGAERTCRLPYLLREPVGRERESAWLDEVSAPGPAVGGAAPQVAASAAVALVTGPAGVGKTALAVHWAGHARARFPDGLLYADLRGRTAAPERSAEVLGRFLRALGTAAEQPPKDPGEMLLHYRSLLKDRRILIVLDDAASVTQVSSLLPDIGPCMVMVTSRTELTGIEGARHLMLDAVDFTPAYRALPKPARRLLRLLGLHPGPELCLPAAAALAGLEPAHTQPLLDALAEAGLIESLPTIPARLRLPDAVAAFALARAEREEPAEELRVARRRVLQWYLHGSYLASGHADLDCYRAVELSFTMARHRPPVIAGPRAALEWYDREWTNLLSALDAAEEHGFPDLLWQLAATLRHAYLRPDRVEACLALQRIALASARRRRNRHAEAVTLDSLALALRRAGRLEEAGEANRSAIALWQLRGERLPEALARLTQARLLADERDWSHAVPLGWAIVASAEGLGERRLEAAALGLLAEGYAETCRFEEARLLLHEAVAIYRAEPWAVGLADALWNTSRVLRQVGRPAAALGPARDALAQAELTSDGVRQGRTLLELARVWHANGHDEKALATFQRATAQARLCLDRGGEARALGSVAEYYRAHGDLSAAHAFDERAVEISRIAGDRWQLALSLDQAAETLDRLKQSVAARRARQEAYALFEPFDEPRAHQARGALAGALDPGPPSRLNHRDRRTVHDGGPG
ncbi:AAA family ATPase [Actinospica robiniae]|uniref:AAA family ATPase n=1 Tax=Actinospica robiniae TaxID=304901 RepID=UPI0012FA8337|nr:AAA family ATPase [Actinospica robiniae]